MSENESEEEIKSDVEMKEEKEIMLKDTSLLDQLSTTKYNYDTNENKEIVFYNYIPMNENFTVQKTKYFELIQKTEKKIKRYLKKRTISKTSSPFILHLVSMTTHGTTILTALLTSTMQRLFFSVSLSRLKPNTTTRLLKKL